MIQKYKSMGVEEKAMTHFMLLIAFMVIPPIVTGLLGFMLLSKIALVLAIVMFIVVSQIEQKKLTAFYSQREVTEAADSISERIKIEQENAEKKFVQMWDDAFEWMTAYDEYFRLMAWADRETNEKIVRQITTLAVQEWVYANQKCATIGARYANAGSADVGIPAPWKESNENSKQLVR